MIENNQQAVDSIQRWAEDNKMKLNVKKTKHMYINTKGDESTITLYNQPLENVDSYKYLGVNINKNLNHDIHWEQMSRTTNSQIYLMKQLKQLKFKQEILINVYRSLTLSHYTYSTPLLISTSANAKNEMTKQQHRFLKIIGITPQKAYDKQNILPIDMFIAKSCTNIVELILKDETHPLT